MESDDDDFGCGCTNLIVEVEVVDLTVSKESVDEDADEEDW